MYNYTLEITTEWKNICKIIKKIMCILHVKSLTSIGLVRKTLINNNRSSTMRRD